MIVSFLTIIVGYLIGYLILGPLAIKIIKRYKGTDSLE